MLLSGITRTGKVIDRLWGQMVGERTRLGTQIGGKEPGERGRSRAGSQFVEFPSPAGGRCCVRASRIMTGTSHNPAVRRA